MSTRRAHVLLWDDTLVERDLGRYLFVLVKYMNFAGFEACLHGRQTLEQQIRAQKWASRLLGDTKVHFAGPVPVEPGAEDIVVSFDEDTGGALAGLKTFQLVKGRRLTHAPDTYDVLFPYMLHPKYYADGRYLEVAGYRSERRKIGLFFSGNYNERYRNPSILAKYGTLQRPALLDLLLHGLPGDQLFSASAEFAVELETGSFVDRFVFVDNLQGNRVAKGHWLETLGQCRFFLACPGVDMPLSHNIVEAMSVGCIPLTQYGGYFDPPLRDGQDCIAHSGSDVVEKARAVLAMDAAQVAALRRNVIDYYERHLSVDAFRRRVLEHPGQRVRVGLNFMPREGIR